MQIQVFVPWKYMVRVYVEDERTAWVIIIGKWIGKKTFADLRPHQSWSHVPQIKLAKYIYFQPFCRFRGFKRLILAWLGTPKCSRLQTVVL